MSYDDDAAEERFGRRKDRRRPVGRRRVRDLQVDSDDPVHDGRFEDPGLQNLYDDGRLLDLTRQVKSGKEATVYLGEGPDGLLAVKLYRDAAARSFKEDAVYREGRFVSDKRVRKAIDAAKRQGLEPALALWVFHEYKILWLLHEAGLPVPRPAVGPSGLEIARAGRVVLMEWIASDEDPEQPAPRLADVALEPDEAAEAWRQSRELLERLLELGLVHGDLSTYNLLWRGGRVVVIDLPQAVEIERNRHAWDLLERDVTSLCRSFRAHGVEEEPQLVLAELRQRFGGGPGGRPPRP